MKLANNQKFRKGYIDKNDLSEVFALLGENVGEDEVNSKCSCSI